MKADQIAAQLFTVRDHLKDPAAIAGSLRKIRDIGYEAVQVSGMGPIEESELLGICKELGLTICATHEKADRILESPESVADRLDALECEFTAYPHPAGFDLSVRSQVEKLAQGLGRAGAALRKRGKTLCYHNHAGEFRRFDSATVLDALYGMTDLLDLQGELDTYWVQAGGGDSVAWCRKLSGRLPLIHLKDYAVSPDGKPTFAEIGRGNLDMKKIITSATEGGCRWFIVEQDSSWLGGDPFASLKASFEYMREKLCDIK